MLFAIQTTQVLHTAANNYRCSDKDCPCQDGHEATTAGPTSLWPLKPGSTGCPWCADELGIPLADRNGSHGICSKHSDEMIAASKARRQKRTQA